MGSSPWESEEEEDKMPGPDADEVIKAFREVDKEGTGELTFSQVRELFEIAVGKEEVDENPQVVDMIFSMADTNGDKIVTLEELILTGSAGSEGERAAAFVKLADKDGNGYITAEELKVVLQKMGMEK